jgi:hypothetical protein
VILKKCKSAVINLAAPYSLFSRVNPEAKKNSLGESCACLQSKIRFDISSIEKIILEPEKILADPDSFWNNDKVYGFVKDWHTRISLPIPMEEWKKWVQNFQNLSMEERKKYPQLSAARLTLKKEKIFNQKAVPYLCSFLPKDCPDISTTIYFTTAIIAAGFQINNHIVIYGGNADKDNLFIHELFHQGYNTYKTKWTEKKPENAQFYQILEDLQNEGIATYVGYKGLKEFPNCRTDMVKDDYRLYENREELQQLLAKLNGLFNRAPSLREKELQDVQFQIGVNDRAFYVVGCYMAQTIDEKSGRNALVKTILKGPLSFISAYNSLVDEKLKIAGVFSRE